MYTNWLLLFSNRIAELIKMLGLALPYVRRIAMYRMLEKMTGEPANLQINHAIIELQGLEVNKDHRSPLWYVYDDILLQMRSSDADFATALSKFVPQQDTMIIAASEQDDITLGFTTVIENNKNIHAMKQAFIQALAYPSFLLCALLGVLYYFSIYLIPVLAANIPPGAQLSITSIFLISMAHSFYIWFTALIVSLFLIIGSVIWALPNLTAGIRKYIENIPPFNMYRLMIGCGFLFALNSLGRAGFMQLDALEQMLKLAKPYLKHNIEMIVNLMADGNDIGEALIKSNLNFPDRQIVRELAIQIKYSEDNALEVLSHTLADDGLTTIKLQAKLLNTMVTLFVFSCIGFLYFSVYQFGADLGNVHSGVNL